MLLKIASAQNITTNAIDDFTQKCIVETYFEKINGKALPTEKVWVAVTNVDDTPYLRNKTKIQ